MGLCCTTHSAALIPASQHSNSPSPSQKGNYNSISITVPLDGSTTRTSFTDLRDSSSSKRDDSNSSSKRNSHVSGGQLGDSSPKENNIAEKEKKSKKLSKLFSLSGDSPAHEPGLSSPPKKGNAPLRKLGSKIGIYGNGNDILSNSPSSPSSSDGQTGISTPPNPKQRQSRRSLLPTDEKVINSRQKWLQEEKAKMADTMAQEWEAIFKDMAKEQGKNELTKTELMEAFQKMGKRIDEEMINKVFVLFDANGDGVVDLTEFMVAMLFLSYRGSAKDNVELAFRLFDTNRSGDVSKREFSEMISSIVGSSIPTLLKIPEAKKLFRENLEQEFATESLNFIDDIDLLKVKYPPLSCEEDSGIPLKEATHILQQYIIEGSPEQININDTLRNKVIASVEEAKHANAEKLLWDSFLAAEEEVIGLLERDKLPRFKKRIRNSGTFANSIWNSIGLNDNNGMSVEQFRAWSNNHRGIFNFLDDMQKVIVEEETRKAAALKIQRAHRRAAHRRGKTATSISTDRFGSNVTRASRFDSTQIGIKVGTMAMISKQDSTMSIFRMDSMASNTNI